MKRWFGLTASFALLLGASADAGYVRGYTRSNGTYVAPYYRSSPSSSGGSYSGSSYSSPAPTLTPLPGVKCGNSYISATKTCRVGTTTYKTVNFSSCDEANENGFANILKNSPAYATALDRDNDGIACESGGDDNGAIDPRYYVASAGVTASTAPSSTPLTTSTSTSPTNNPGVCPAFKLTPSSVTITVPAVFPNPETTKSADSYTCGGWEVTYSGSPYDYPSNVKVKAPTWQDAWKRLSTDLYLYIDVSYTGKLVLDGGMINYVSPYSNPKFEKGIVVAVSANGGPLMPVVFNGVVTPQSYGQAPFTLYQKRELYFSGYQQITIDPGAATVSMTNTAVWPR